MAARPRSSSQCAYRRSLVVPLRCVAVAPCGVVDELEPALEQRTQGWCARGDAVLQGRHMEMLRTREVAIHCGGIGARLRFRGGLFPVWGPSRCRNNAHIVR